jgi:hypothetical protein
VSADVLFVGGGRRVSLARLFKARGLRVAGYDLATDVPLASEGPVVAGRRWDDEGFGDHLHHAARALGARLVLPLDCRGVFEVAKLKSRKTDDKYVVSTTCAAHACLNKDEFAARCPPEYYPSPRQGLEYVEKPSQGFGSHDITYGHYHDATCDFIPKDRVRQMRMVGDEYSVDAYFDVSGRLVSASPRLRVWVAGGEVIESVTVDEPDLVRAVRDIGAELPFRGPACFQFMKDNGRPYCIEVNARFGGGAPLSVHAGWAAVDWLVREYYLGEALPETTYETKARPGVRTVRSYEDHFFG